jgi:asparagine synthase (glutamine-hydrolysing)
MVLAWHNPAPGTLPCYTFGGKYRESEDVLIARRVAEACRQPHAVIPVGDRFLQRFAQYAERTIYLTDGCAGVMRAPDLYVNEVAREIAPVRITGNYGGEVLRRVRAFKPVSPAPGVFAPEFEPEIARAAETFRCIADCHPLSFAVFRQAPWHHYGLLALEETQLSVRSPYLDNEFVKTVFRAPPSSLEEPDISIRLIKEGNPALSALPTDRGAGAGSRGLAAALAGRLREALFKAEYVYDYGMPQWLAHLDRAASFTKPERLFLGRHKFYHFRVWYRGELSGYVREILLDSVSLRRPYVRAPAVEQLVKAHTAGRGNFTTEIHRLLSLELLHRLLVDRAVPTTGTV